MRRWLGVITLCGSVGCASSEGSRLPKAAVPASASPANQSPAMAGVGSSSPQRFQQLLSQRTAGYTLAATLPGRLEGLATVKYAVVRGQCYLAVVLLEGNASFTGIPQDSLSVQSTIPGEGTRIHANAVDERGVIADVGCPLEVGNLSFDVIFTERAAKEQGTSLDSDKGGASAPALRGPYQLQFYSRGIGESALEALKHERDREAQQRADEQQLGQRSTAALRTK